MYGLSRFITKRFKAIILIWLIIVIAMGFFAIRLPEMLLGDGFRMDGEHSRVMDITVDTFDLPAETMFVVFKEKKVGEIEKILDKINGLGLTSSIVSPLEDASLYTKNLSYAMLHFNDKDIDMSEMVTKIRDVIDNEDGIVLTGAPAISKDINTASQKDLMTAESIGLPMAIIVLLFAFGTVVASIIPLIIGLCTVIVSFGMLTILGGHLDLSIFILNIIPMLGLALSIDFALLFISRYREERTSNTLIEAVSKTIQTAGRAVLFSAFCVFIGLGAMMLIRVDIFQNIAVGGMIVVSMSVLSSITLLPSLLILLGDRMNKWKILRVRENSSDQWRNFALGVIKRPVIITIFSLMILGIAVIPVRNIELTIPSIDALPKSYESREAFEEMQDTFGLEEKSTVYIVATRDNGWDNKRGLEELQRIEDKLTSDPLVDDVTTIYSLSGFHSAEEWEQARQVPGMSATLKPIMDRLIKEDKLLIPVTLAAKGVSSEAQDWVRDFSDNNDLLVGGQPKFNQEIFDEISNKIGQVLTVIIVSTFFILLLAFRSILIPIKAILMNIFGLSATFGILVYIFQYGHFGLPEGTIALIIPVIVFSLVFGLSMDYEVFLISRMQEEYAKTLDNDRATVEGLATTSKIITSAALIMIVLTGAFAFTDVMPVKQIGVGIAIAVTLDATIIRLLLVPSLMKLFGNWNWWLPFRKGKYKAGGWH